jgi:hypothetical protein
VRLGADHSPKGICRMREGMSCHAADNTGSNARRAVFEPDMVGHMKSAFLQVTFDTLSGVTAYPPRCESAYPQPAIGATVTVFF